MTPELCMQFLVWSYYYHDILPEKERSYGDYNRFAANDVQRLDGLKEMLFKCFEASSIQNACKQFQLAKERKEACPYPKDALDTMFAKETRV